MPNSVKTYATVVGIPIFKGKILILKRNPDRSSSPNKWQPVSGYIGEKEPAEEAVLREIKEETGLDGEIVKKGDILEITDEWGRWASIPYLVSVETDEVKIDQDEHTEYKWIEPERIDGFDCVAGIRKKLESVEVL